MTELLRSDLNAFLFTPIAADTNGMHLTMLSALARAGADPWEKAAGLRALSKGDATEKLIDLLAGMPNGPSPGNDRATLAAHLVGQLHSPPETSRRQKSPPTVPPQSRQEPAPQWFSSLPRPLKRAIYSLAALTVIILGYRALFSG